jgi:2'-5' RNA ligase
MSQKLRTFIAVETPRAVQEAADRLAKRLQAAGADVRWVAAQNLHFTLKFLGDVAAERTPEICRAVAQAAAAQEPFEVEIRGAGAFPALRRPRTLWLGSAAGKEPFCDLQAKVDKELRKLGFAREHRAFEPHLTIGRVRDGRHGLEQLARLLEEERDFAAGSMSVTELVTFSSELSPRGSIYTPLGRAALASP